MHVQQPAIALIEFGGHFDNQYSQLRFLAESGFDVHLVAGPDCAELMSGYAGTHPLYRVPAVRGRLDMLRVLRQLHRYLRVQRVGTAVISSYSGDMVKLFMLLKPKQLRVFGVVHGTEKLTRSRWVRLLARRVSGFFVLNDHLLAHCPKNIGPVRSTYTIFYPPYPKKDIGKEAGAFHVCIPGQLEYKRRNYIALLEELNETLHPSIRFILLGRSAHAGGDGADFRARIPERHRHRFVFFDSFIDEDIFHSHIAAADLIMPLLGGRERYRSEAISGTFNLAFGYRTPMLVEEEFMFIEDMRVCAFPYRPGGLVDMLNELQAGRVRLEQKGMDIAAHPKLGFEYQRAAYVDFITDGTTR